MSILPRDTSLSLPDFTVVSASAGSGKTHTLALRMLQLLLSERIPHNDLRNILAITFTNNAAAEMKQRIVSFLKQLALPGQPVADDLAALTDLTEEQLRLRAATVLDAILDRYGDFQVRTIDSFLITIFKTVALEFGQHPDAEIILDPGGVVEAAVADFSREAAHDAQKRIVLERVADLLLHARTSTQRYVWDPYQTLLREGRELFHELQMRTAPLDQTDPTRDMGDVVRSIGAEVKRIRMVLAEAGLPVKQGFLKDLDDLADGRIDAVLKRTDKRGDPLRKLSQTEEARWSQIRTTVEPAVDAVYVLLERYAYLMARARSYPAVSFLGTLDAEIAALGRRTQQITLDEINALLRDYLHQGVVPEIFFTLGDAIRHYLIDEFQDTSPLQWHNLKPLMDETLAKDGSLFVVGDMKQSIYGFRGADWRIMRRLLQGTEFGSVEPRVIALPKNYRSAGAIVEFNRTLFHERVRATPFLPAAEESGLTAYEQSPLDTRKRKGFVSVEVFPDDNDLEPARERMRAILTQCFARGYRIGDVAILTHANADVVTMSSWLNAWSIPFVSHSTLDVRERPVIAEILALMRFLDTPEDGLALSAFLNGTVLTTSAGRAGLSFQPGQFRDILLRLRRQGGKKPGLLRTVREEFAEVWERFLVRPFNAAGYLPVYDLASLLVKTFDLFGAFPAEEASIVKFLEAVREFEGNGNPSLGEFIRFAREESADAWTLAVPHAADAVTVMTIHKAKGLDFPVVIAVLRDQMPEPGGTMVDDAGERAVLLSPTKPLRGKNPRLRELWDRELLLARADALNKLYVMFTRAEEEMYVLAMRDEKKPGLVGQLLEPETVGKPAARVRPASEPGLEPTPRRHHTGILKIVTSDRRRPALRETGRGDLIHALLSNITVIPGDARSAMATAGDRVPPDLWEGWDRGQIAHTVESFLLRPGVEEWFRPRQGRSVENELEIADASGELFRCDRVVVDADRVTVIDFKTGGAGSEEEYRRQVRNYIALLRDVYAPHAVVGAIAYVDQDRWVDLP